MYEKLSNKEIIQVAILEKKIISEFVKDGFLELPSFSGFCKKKCKTETKNLSSPAILILMIFFDLPKLFTLINFVSTFIPPEGNERKQKQSQSSNKHELEHIKCKHVCMYRIYVCHYNNSGMLTRTWPQGQGPDPQEPGQGQGVLKDEEKDHS